ncbi:MAG TPA: NBR1-Ig-like domain-containing protein [Anaerolineaceae bacterium]|jgi:hypothetical protein|nr:NBR1-Ig-like domain-containing protein [Anaerolineaceae bacterium]
MDIKKVPAIIIVIFSVMLAACNIRISTITDEDKVNTAVAQTIVVQQQATVTPLILPTITGLPTITQQSNEPTGTPQPCNKAAAVSESYPDDSEVTIGTDFDKSWRLQNIGTCTWNSNYRIVFYDGDQMGGPNSQKLNTTVAPGEVTDIIIDQKAPNAAGTYKGTWKLQDDSGANFATVWVQIKAVNQVVQIQPPLHLLFNIKTVSQASGEGGSVRSDGTVMSGLYNVGDLPTNGSSQVFVSFDISGIPADATITEVRVDFTDFDMLDDPFGDLGCLRAYVQNYGNLDAGDYFGGVPIGAIGRWCSAGELQTVAVDDDFKSALQSAVGNSRFRIRLQFSDKLSDNDNTGDMVRFGTIKLRVIY